MPLLAGPLAAGDRRPVAAATSALLTWTLALLIPLAAVVALAAEPIIAAFAPAGTPADAVDAGALMLRIFAPQLPLYGIGIVLTGVLQAHRRFAWPVLAPLLSSVVVAATYGLFAAHPGRPGRPPGGRRRRPAASSPSAPRSASSCCRCAC